jgi:hypothetical protein
MLAMTSPFDRRAAISPDNDQLMPLGSHHENAFSAPRLTFRHSGRDCLAASRRLRCASASAAEVPYSISDSFEVHYDAHRRDDSMERYSSSSGLSFATQRLNSHSYRDHRFEGWNRQMPHYRHLLNEVVRAAETERLGSTRFAEHHERTRGRRIGSRARWLRAAGWSGSRVQRGSISVFP